MQTASGFSFLVCQRYKKRRHSTIAMKADQIKPVLEKAILAPSADNMQPWKFRLSDDGVDLFLTKNRDPHLLEVGLKSLYVSVGAVIENIRVAALHHGYRAIPSHFPEGQDPTFVARIRFETSPIHEHPHYFALEQRATNRKFYNLSRQINDAIYQKLRETVEQSAAANQISSQSYRLVWIKRKNPGYRPLCRMISFADQLRYESPKIHREFMETVRFSKAETESTCDGLDIRTFEAGPCAPVLFNLIRSWPRLRLLNWLGLSRMFNFYSWLQLMSSQAIGLLVGPTHSNADYINGGETMERLWHEITLQGLAIQPMMALPIFLLCRVLNYDQGFGQEQNAKLDQLQREFISLFGITKDNALIFLFRMGYAKSPTARSLRRPLESFLL